ncbi:putative adenosine/adenine deaminase [Flexivirga endophytica]|uniref:Adenosine/adenine deaminase n=1 Tax=Flexivirga endophytica TaxID=1849103 RepID=A0A916WTB8_9MICO|nr:adenosine deaminase [Flexivirga endophytica]GGB27852.1 putative adenosine/adenine deaminase [Flexivirga endophytica]GHB61682.1 putative adenosine/adenine deaminase [Flexivirga endophytica]
MPGQTDADRSLHPQRPVGASARSVLALPKAHLHLHFTGSLRIASLRELAVKHGVRLPESLLADWPPTLSARDERGWFRFQRLYDAARACVKDESDLRRLVREAAEDDVAEGSRWLEIQVDPTSYAGGLGGITPALEIVLDEARSASADLPIGVGVIVAASRLKHPMDARALARLAAKHAGDQPGEVVGFGLSNDERRGTTTDFAPAFRIARRAGLASVPHSGELLGPDAITETVASLQPTRLGHGVRSVESRSVLNRVIDSGIALEVCPGSNVALGVYQAPDEVPLRTLVDAGATVALGADDPLLFGNRLADQYRSAREDHDFTDHELAALARSSIDASLAPADVRRAAYDDIDRWLVSVPGD